MGVDIGTTCVKAVIYKLNGGVVTSSHREYFQENIKEGWLELNPEEVWKSVREVIRDCNAKNIYSEIKALAFSTLGESVTPIGVKGEILYNTILAADNRSVNESNWIAEKMGNRYLKDITGQVCHPRTCASKVLWLKHNLPEVFQKARWFLGWQGLVCLKLGFMPFTDYSSASRTMMFDISSKKWSQELLSVIGVVKNNLAMPRPAGTVIGDIPKPICDELGFKSEVKLILGGFDQTCTSLGAGIISTNKSSLGLGTVACLSVIYNHNTCWKINKSTMNYPVIPYACKDMYMTTASTLGGRLLGWFRDNFSKWECQQAEETGENVYNLILKDITFCPTKLFFLPYFTGSGTAWADPLARGSLIGLTIQNTRQDVIKAILEGVIYEIKLNLYHLQNFGLEIENLRVSGGGARSKIWLQLVADITGLKVSTLNTEESGCLGAAILAGVGVGIYESIPKAIEIIVKEKDSFVPDRIRNKLYQERFEIYYKIYSALKELYERMAILS